MFTKKGKLLTPEALAKGKKDRENKVKADNLRSFLKKVEVLVDQHALSLAEFKLGCQLLTNKYQEKAEKEIITIELEDVEEKKTIIK